jgi:hypothetical protein
MSFSALSGSVLAYFNTSFWLPICKISGLKEGRFFNSNIFSTAVSDNPLAAKPYTVSVGIAATSFAFNA